MIVMIKTIKVNMEVAAENPGFIKAEKKSFRWTNQSNLADGVKNTVKSIFGQGGFGICFKTANNPVSEYHIFFTCRYCMSKGFLSYCFMFLSVCFCLR